MDSRLFDRLVESMTQMGEIVRAEKLASAKEREELHPWDVTDHLQTEEDIALFIEAAQQEAPGDEAFMAKVTEEVKRARRLNEARSAPDAENPEWTDRKVEDSIRFDHLPPSLQQKLKP